MRLTDKGGSSMEVSKGHKVIYNIDICHKFKFFSLIKFFFIAIRQNILNNYTY